MRINFLGIPVDALTMEETLERIDQAIQRGEHIDHVVINAGKVVAIKEDPALFESVVSCDIINADGQSIVWAARFLGKNLPERVAGIDLMQNLLLLSHKRKYSCYFLGAKEEIVRKVVKIVSHDYGSEIVAGYRNGYFTTDDEQGIAREIAESKADILFVAMSSPKKEIFLHRNNDLLKSIKFTMGVGGSFDVIAGVTSRAPHWLQKFGMEWFFRFIQEPKRMWRRYLVGNTSFLWLVFKERFRKGN